MNRDQYEKEIDRLDSLADSEDEFEGAVRVTATIAKDRRSLFSLRIGADELTELANAARIRSQSISEFIRNAALREARHDTHDVAAPVLEALEELVRRYQAEQQGIKRRRKAAAKPA